MKEKEIFEPAEIEIIQFETEDIITTSSGINLPPDSLNFNPLG